MKIKIKTTSGETTVDTDKISAISQTTEKGGFLRNPTIMLDIHMDSGTIFEAMVTEAELVVLYHAWGVDSDE